MKTAEGDKKAKTPEVYYFTDGLYIQMPNQSTQTYSINLMKKQEDEGKKNLAMNLLNEYKIKKKQENFQPKLQKSTKMDIDNIIIRTERFLQERQEKINKLTVENLEKNGNHTHQPKINEYSKNLTRNLNSLLNWQSQKISHLNKKKEEMQKSSEEQKNFTRYYLPKPGNRSNNHSLEKSSSFNNSKQHNQKLPHSKSFGSLPVTINISHQTNKIREKRSKSPPKQIIKSVEIGQNNKKFQKSEIEPKTKKSKTAFNSKNQPQINNSNSLILLEDNLIQEITAINDKIEDLIINQKPLLPPAKNLPLASIKKLTNELKNQEILENKNPIHPQIKKIDIPLERIQPQQFPEENSSRMKVFAKWLDLSVYDRNNLWMRDKTQRLEHEKTAKKNNYLQECTFKPKISQNVPSVSPEKYGTFDIDQMKKIFRDVKKTHRNTYSNQRTLKKRYSSVNKPMNVPD